MTKLFFISAEYKPIMATMERSIHTIYTNVFEEFEKAQYIWVSRNSGGDYHFTSSSTFGDSVRRIEELEKAWLEALQQQNRQNTRTQIFINGGARNVSLLTGQQIENLLFAQFPRIVWFREEYSLIDALPDRITSNLLSSNSSPLTSAFVTFLGADAVKHLLITDNPRERRSILSELNAKVQELTVAVNQGQPSVADVLNFDLDLANGLQITALTGRKQSFYRQISDNTKFLFAYHLYSRVQDLQGSVLLFDEPNNGFHATSQEKLLKFLQALGKSGTLVILSTHSEHMIDSEYLGNVRLMGVDSQASDAYLRIVNHYYAPIGGPGDYLALRPIADAIGLKYGAIRFNQSDRIIVTEGVTDRLYLQSLAQLLGYEGFSFAPAAGEKAIPHVLALLIAQGFRFKLAIDTATGGNTTKNVVQRVYGIEDQFIHEVSIPTSSKEKKGSGVEDLFSKADFQKLLERLGWPISPEFMGMSNSEYMNLKTSPSKRVIADWLNKNINLYKKADFDDETLRLFRETLDFCANEHWFALEQVF
ncbi:MAG: AAA family ATPase [Ktedonobacterales bacterium]